jgi:2-methylisocitrate lyase-like PEP mutase family enzyme
MPGSEQYERFMALHTRDGGLVMPNAWDGFSALMVADASFEKERLANNLGERFQDNGE